MIEAVDKVVAFDLDKTLFYCVNSHGQQIWGKQMIPPFERRGSEALTDDVGSICTLNPVAASLLISLQSRGITCCFVSLGRYTGLVDDLQPSLSLLKLFQVFDCFDLSLSSLEYKTVSKSTHFNKFKNTRFLLIDDNPSVRAEVERYSNCKTLDIADEELVSEVEAWLQI